MKAISVRAPWAWLFVPRYWDRVPADRRRLGPDGPALTGPKDVENRSPIFARQFQDYRGPLAIHVSKGMAEAEREWASWFCLDDFLPRGAVICVVRVRGIRMRMQGSEWTGSPWHEQFRAGINVAEPRELARPLPWRGALHVFDVPDAEIARALAHVPEQQALFEGGCR